MFRCKECQTEYETKPDYCDCGNDTFEEINPQPKITPQPEEQKTEIIENQSAFSKQAKVEPVKISQTDRVKTSSSKKKTSKPFFDPASTIIFAICIILSVIIVFFVGNPKDEIQTADGQKDSNQKTAQNIPNIDKFWNNALPKQESKVVTKPEPPQEAAVERVPVQAPIQQPVIVYQQAPVTQVQQQAKPVKQTGKNISQPQYQVQKQTISQNTHTTKQSTPQQNQQVVQQPKAQTQQPVATTPTTPKVTPKKTTVTVNQKELENYKVALRNKIAGKMNFVNVIGDGTCVVSFTVSSSGVLLNRKFAKQSDNFTLNDVVYNAVMQTPSYNPPPSGYKNETMKLTIKMYNGNYEVSLY